MGHSKTDWFGYLFIAAGLHPWCKNRQHSTNATSKNQSHIYGFLSAVNHYRFGPKMPIYLLHSLVSLANLPSTVGTKWKLLSSSWKPLWCSTVSFLTSIKTQPFAYTNASNYQTCIYIAKDDRPVSVWICKLNDANHKYTVRKKELLYINMILTELCTMLLITANYIFTWINSTLPKATTHLTVFCAGSTILNISILAFILSLLRTKFLLTLCLILINKRANFHSQWLCSERNGLCRLSTPCWMVPSPSTNGSVWQ